MRNNKTLILTEAALIAALCYTAFTFLQIKIPVPGGDATSIHFGNVFLVLGALLLGGFWGGLAGAVGMTIGDLMDPIYIVVAPKTFVLKFCIGLIVGLVAHKIGQISKSNDSKHVFKMALIGSIAGMSFNVIFDPLVGYFYKVYVLGQPQEAAEILAKISAGVTLFNAMTTVFVAMLLYVVIRPIMIKTNMLPNR